MDDKLRKRVIQLDRIIRRCARRHVARWPGERVDIMDENDLTHHVWEKLLENDGAHIENLLCKDQSLASLVWRFADNRIKDLKRKQLRREEILPIDSDERDPAGFHPTPEDVVGAMQLRDCLHVCLNRKLSRREQTVFDLRYRQDQANKSIAEKLNVTQQAVANRINRIKEHVRACLAECERTKHNKSPRDLE